MFDALGLMVSRLIRTRYGVVSMPPQLKRGQMIELERDELDALLKAAGMQDDDEGEDRSADDWQPGNGGRQGCRSGRGRRQSRHLRPRS